MSDPAAASKSVSQRQPPPQLRRAVKAVSCKVSLDYGVADRPGPAILCVRGLWPGDYFMNELFDYMPHTDIVVADLPGTRLYGPSPATAAQFSLAMDEVVAKILRGRDVVALGVSTGALVTLGLTRPEIRSHVVVEPFLRTGNLWPLIDYVREDLVRHPDSERRRTYARELFGYSLGGIDDLDFRGLARSVRVPIRPVYGGRPLPARRTTPAWPWPSLSDEETRATFASVPGARPAYTASAETGHHVTQHEAGWALVLQALRDAMAELGDPDSR
jgi:hypothetical protein